MRRWGCFVAVALATVWLGLVFLPPAASATDDARQNPIPAPTTGCYVGAYVSSGTPGLASFDEQARKRQAFFMTFVEVGDKSFSEGDESSVERFCQGCYAAGALPYLTLQPDHATSSSLLTTADVAWLEDFTKVVGALKRPVFIRFAHEMNGDWYPWGWRNVTPDVYIHGYRQVADAFHRNAPQAALLWAPSQNWGPSVDPLYSHWYPGDEYVDWVGLTSYQWPFSGLGSHQFVFSISCGQGPEGDFYSTFAVGHDKPMMLTETAAGDDDPTYYDNEWSGGTQDETGTYGMGVGQGSQNWWIRQVYSVGNDAYATNVRYPRIHAVCWFSQGDYAFGGADLTAHSTGFSEYARVIADPYWLSSAIPPPVTEIGGVDSHWVDHEVTFSLTATDAYAPDGIVTYFRLNGGERLVYDQPVTISADGTTTIAYHSVDASGNGEADRTAICRIDRTGPATTSNSEDSWHGAPVLLSLTAIDAMSGVAGTEYRIGTDPATRTYVSPVLVSAEGTTDVEFWSTDSAGNKGSRNTVTVRVDMTPPVTSSDATCTYVGPACLRLAATDTASGVALTRYQLDSGPWVTGGTADTSVTGLHTLRWHSVDVAGNIECTRSVAFAVAEPLPRTGAISGWVKAAGRAGLEHVTVSVDGGHSAVTAPGGSFGLSNVAQGPRTLTVSAPHYQSATWPVSVSAGATTTLGLVMQPVRLPLCIARRPGANRLAYRRKRGVAKFTLSARLADARGALPAGVRVILQRSTNGKTWSTVARLATDGKGVVRRQVAIKKRGAAYYRWSAPETAYDSAGVTARQRIAVR